MSDFYIRLLSHIPGKNSNTTNYPKSSVKEIDPVHIGVFTCSVYFVSKGYIVHSSDINGI